MGERPLAWAHTYWLGCPDDQGNATEPFTSCTPGDLLMMALALDMDDEDDPTQLSASLAKMVKAARATDEPATPNLE